tara:strand:+ start:194 stop:547 length:354 start_codon:yes stop_codon:yes gene_type:complete
MKLTHRAALSLSVLVIVSVALRVAGTDASATEMAEMVAEARTQYELAVASPGTAEALERLIGAETLLKWIRKRHDASSIEMQTGIDVERLSRSVRRALRSNDARPVTKAIGNADLKK